jgi:hypothetical protein
MHILIYLFYSFEFESVVIKGGDKNTFHLFQFFKPFSSQQRYPISDIGVWIAVK